MATKEQNQKYFNDATSTLNKLATNLSTPKNIRKNITDLINDLKTGDYPVSVRAANAISLLDGGVRLETGRSLGVSLPSPI